MSAPAATIFADERHRVTSLLGGVVEEDVMLRERVETLKETKLQAFIVSNPSDTWQKKDNDETEFGIKADGAPMSQHLVLPCDNTAHLLPDVGKKCEFYMPMDIKRRPVPQVEVTVSYVDELVFRLADQISAAKQNTLNAFPSDASEAERQHAHENFVAAIASLIFPELKGPSDEAVAEAKGATKEQQCLITANTMAEGIAQTELDGGVNMHEYLGKWAYKHARVRTEPPFTQ
ncbi:hypothetical protein BGZ63DRAFT_409364 [Mariannaea sp. PMI_226]|nr:hypothetical protein BGZ63DRAFT_409364 [Mariannaea sp. PMI_226]